MTIGQTLSYHNCMAHEHDMAWLAGFWDGEGSIGLVKNKKTLILSVQLSHTEIDTVLRVLELLKPIGGRGYTYQERDPAKHRDAHYVRVSGISNIQRLAAELLPYAVTKRRHWEIAAEWCASRILVAGGVGPDV